jgi:predicted ArsR family transcriptional regulator
MNTTCPYRKAAEASPAPCHADHRAVQLLVGAPVDQVTRMVEGHSVCEYVVREVARSDEEDRAESPQEEGTS